MESSVYQDLVDRLIGIVPLFLLYISIPYLSKDYVL